MWFPFKKKSAVTNQITTTEQLAGIYAQNNGDILYGSYRSHKIAPSNAYLFYEKVSVIYDAIDKIARRVAGLTIVSKNKSGDIGESELSKLLNAPSSETTKSELMSDLATSLELTSEAWIVARGNINKTPLEIVSIKPYHIEGSFTNKGKMPNLIRTKSPLDEREYTKTELNGVVRYIDEMGLNELIPIIAKTYRNDWRGLSKLSPLVQEVGHINNGNIHNTSMLSNGLSPSVILTPAEGDIDLPQGEKIKEALRRHHAGSGNAGKALILPNKMVMVSQSTTNKDMDYIQLIDVDETRVYRLFNIPLPIVKSSSMTQSNYSVAIPFFYSEAVFPAFEYIAEQLTLKLGRRSKIDGDTLTFNEFDIPALNDHQVGIMQKLRETKAFSTNEIRNKGGYENTDSDMGDKVIISSSDVTLDSIEMEASFGDFGDGDA